MNNLEDLEKKINSELTTKINSTEIKHNQLYIEIDKEDIIDATLSCQHFLLCQGFHLNFLHFFTNQ